MCPIISMWIILLSIELRAYAVLHVLISYHSFYLLHNMVSTIDDVKNK